MGTSKMVLFQCDEAKSEMTKGEMHLFYNNCDSLSNVQRSGDG